MDSGHLSQVLRIVAEVDWKIGVLTAGRKDAGRIELLIPAHHQAWPVPA
jgi:hypothetical protein